MIAASFWLFWAVVAFAVIGLAVLSFLFDALDRADADADIDLDDWLRYRDSDRWTDS